MGRNNSWPASPQSLFGPGSVWGLHGEHMFGDSARGMGEGCEAEAQGVSAAASGGGDVLQEFSTRMSEC